MALTAFVAALAAPNQPGVPNCTVHWHTQALDHFNFAENRTFKQRVLRHDGFYRPGGPILFYTGNEANVELYVNATGWMWENAGALGALLVFAEHRYYGESLPLGAASTANGSTLRWLTMEQALADFASVIYDVRRELKAPQTPVVAIGGSYGGMLAAWLRLHYPSSVVGALAASAPVLAFDGLPSAKYAKFDGNSYWRAVTRDATPAAGAAAGCEAGVRASWPHLFAAAATAEGRATLGRAFSLCDPLASAADGERLAATLLNAWDTLAMGNFPYRSNYLVYQQTQDPSVTLPPWPFRAACAHFAGANASTPASELLAAAARAASVLYNASGKSSCLAVAADPNFDGIWDYQYCTERLPQETYFSLDGGADMFWRRPANATAIAEHCAAKYGVKARAAWVSTIGFEGASNIVFTNGEYDPWRAGGVVTNLSASVIALEVKQGAHHLDLMFENDDDPPSVRAVRSAQLSEVRRWIS